MEKSTRWVCPYSLPCPPITAHAQHPHPLCQCIQGQHHAAVLHGHYGFSCRRRESGTEPLQAHGHGRNLDLPASSEMEVLSAGPNLRPQLTPLRPRPRPPRPDAPPPVENCSATVGLLPFKPRRSTAARLRGGLAMAEEEQGRRRPRNGGGGTGEAEASRRRWVSRAARRPRIGAGEAGWARRPRAGGGGVAEVRGCLAPVGEKQGRSRSWVGDV